ncbi:MAG: aminotransferase class IV family protein [Bacteroidetes bacterium]|nr:aminotransferase class IV family protein [Bacteroidota bacterium]MBS1540303.1 aminotransferase class IV family protein [Bacteroidota bacterium]
MYSFLNNEFLSAEKTFIHASDLATQRGYGIFDFFKIMNGRLLFVEDYFDRFYRSAEIMRLPISLSREELKKVILELVQKNGVSDCGIKMILTGGYSPGGYEIASPNLIITQHSLTMPGTPVLDKGIKIITHEYVRDIPHVKTINYITGIWLQKRIKDEHAADVLYHLNGLVSEFPRCNLFIVKEDRTVITPAKRVLHGITRKNILNLNGKDFSIREDDVSLQDVFKAKEVFLTSTTKRVIPIVQVDDTMIGIGKPGEISLRILEALIETENKN